ncbi:MerR family transcriptional regulator [Bradyrhizobium sp. 2TAF24]|uniref:MerR family transcriptional regulator n=1 Tax=Bradyrhizobium sp. 2TAF24 TaxID=3233011 RepID=UPI003F90C566
MDKAPDAFRTISEVADDLDIPQHVLRFWETRFSQIKPMKRSGGRRYYRPDDVDLLRGIRRLLYGEGYTIKGVQRILREQGIKAVQGLADETAAAPSAMAERPRPAAPAPQRAAAAAESDVDDDERADDDDGDEDAVAADAHDEGDEAADEDEEIDAADDEADEDEGEDDDEEAEAPPVRAAPPIPPQRAAGRDTSFTGRVEPVLHKAPVAPPVAPRVAPPPPERHREPPRAGLTPADAAKLKSALDDLMACKRLVDDALKGMPPEIFPVK